MGEIGDLWFHMEESHLLADLGRNRATKTAKRDFQASRETNTLSSVCAVGIQIPSDLLKSQREVEKIAT